jgi:2-keto-3-deoxy-L-rhamnonate aldolase RhmA
MSIITENRVKRALRDGKFVVGTMVVEIRQPAVMQLLKNAGFDFAIIDNEHGPFNIETIADLSRSAKQIDLTPLVRVPDLFYPYIAQSLDSGAQGVMVPRIFHAEQVREAVQMVKYPPTGRRGCALARGFTDFKGGPVSEAMAQTNEESMLIIQIETQEAVENIEEIAAVPGVDVALVGPNDLSIALGVPGQMDSSKLHAAIEKVIDTCQRNNVFPALHINNLDWGMHWVDKGMRMLSLFSEAGLMTRGGLEITSKLTGRGDP